MKDFPVRAFRFEIPRAGQGDQTEFVIWSRTSPEFSVFINAFAMHVPHFESLLVQVMGEAHARISSLPLRKDVKSLMGQEANHAHNLKRLNALLRERYPTAIPQDDESIAYFQRLSSSTDLRAKVGFVTGYETFTFLAGMIILANHDRWFADADPAMKALVVWHQVEEIEHGAVAFEVWQELYGRHEWARKGYVLKAAIYIAWEIMRLYPKMLYREGWLGSPGRALKSLGFGLELLARLFWAALPVFRRSYHPRQHPIATHAQNPIQMAWRRFEAQGGNVLQLDRNRLQEIFALSPNSAESTV
jgi:hypothetical protein